MTRTTLAATLAALMTSLPASAGNYVVGPMPLSCGGWISAKEQAPGYYGPTSRAQYISWVWGFLSGVEMATGQHKIETTDADFITAWMDNYCANYALNDLGMAAAALWNQLGTASAQ